MQPKARRVSKTTVTAASVGGLFEPREALLETLRQGPTNVLPEPGPPTKGQGSCWKLKTIRHAVPWLQSYSLSGVWRVLRRSGLKLRTAQVQHYSPDADYEPKVAHLLACLQETARHRDTTVLLFMDEMGYYCWPAPTTVWVATAPAPLPHTDRQGVKQQQWRIIGVLNALSGQVDYLDGYVVGRAKVIAMYKQIIQRYNWAARIYVVQDNWNIHHHDAVVEALSTMPTIEPVWLPTYAPWLNPIEKLWRWLRQDVLKMHRLAAQWSELRQRVNTFLDQFAHGSSELLCYVGLAGKGKLAQAIRAP
jgi:transposase